MGLFRPSPNAVPRPRSGRTSNLKDRISGPIPVDDEFPMRKPGDDEFPIRNPGSGFAHEVDPIDSQTTTTPQDNSVVGDAPDPGVARADKTRSTAEVSNAPSAPRRLQSRGTARSSTLRHSVVSSADRSSGNAQFAPRRKSTLKSAFGRLFGRKKKDPVLTPPPESRSPIQTPAPENHHESTTSSGPPTSHHLSTPSGDLVAGPDPSETPPVTDFDRALRSHSIGPDDIIAIESARTSIHVDPASGRRRATTTSGVSSLPARDFSGETWGLSPRPVSAHGCTSPEPEDVDPEEIGCAVTSDAPSPVVRRRSRSLSQLQSLAGRDSQARNRSDEIRYWRASHEPGSIPHSPVVASHDDNNNNTHRTAAIGSSFGSPAESRPVTSRQHHQSFSFPLIPGDMKMNRGPGLEERIANLEARNDRLEKLISQLLSSPAISPSKENDNPSIDQQVLRDPPRPASNHSDASFADGITYVDSINAPSTRQPPTTAAAAPVNSRPISTSTVVREATSLPSLPRDLSGTTVATTISVDQYTFLKALLDTERAARRMLEDQVTNLTHRLSLLSTRASQLIPPTSNDNNSKLYIQTKNSNAHQQLQHSKSMNYSIFDDDDDEEEEREDQHEPQSALSDPNYTESEAYRTPVEGSSIADDDVDDVDAEEREDGQRSDGGRVRRKAPRTLSMGQLTLGNPPPKHHYQNQPFQHPLSPPPKVQTPALGVDF